MCQLPAPLARERSNSRAELAVLKVSVTASLIRRYACYNAFDIARAPIRVFNLPTHNQERYDTLTQSPPPSGLDPPTHSRTTESPIEDTSTDRPEFAAPPGVAARGPKTGAAVCV